jgi:hypothetical protein
MNNTFFFLRMLEKAARLSPCPKSANLQSDSLPIVSPILIYYAYLRTSFLLPPGAGGSARRWPAGLPDCTR